MSDAARWRDEWTDKAERAPNPFARTTWDVLKTTKAKMLLDLGCGDGRDALFFAEKGLEVTAIDFSESGIAILQSMNPAITASVMDIQRVEFPDASFDAIYAHLSIHYFDDAATKDIIQNIHRMLRPGGFFFVKCKSVHDPLFGQGEKVGEDLYRTDHVRHFFSLDYMRKSLQDFKVLLLQETTDSYDGKTSAFIEAVGERK